MEYIEFIKLVQSMRSAQSRFFKSKSKQDLREAVRLENQVDEAVIQLLAGGEEEKPKFIQQSLL